MHTLFMHLNNPICVLDRLCLYCPIRTMVPTCLHFSVVMSSCRATTLGMGLMGTRSTPVSGTTKNPWVYLDTKTLHLCPSFYIPSKNNRNVYWQRISQKTALAAVMIIKLKTHSPIMRLDTGINLDATCNLRSERQFRMHVGTVVG